MPRERQPKTVVIIGAGVTGLTAAHDLHLRGHRVYLLEKSDRPGGVIRSARVDGYLIEAGPNTMLLNDPALLTFFQDLGLGDDLLEAAPAAKHRYLVRNGQPVAAPMSLGEFIKTPLLSARAKWRLFAEPFIRRAPADREESVAQFVERRLGGEIVHRAINPLIAGIYAGDPDKLSVRHAFPLLHRFERDHGSLLRGAIAARRAKRKVGTPKFETRSISFRHGLQAIIDALVHVVGDSLYAGATIEEIQPGTPWCVRFTRPGESTMEVKADAVLATTPAYATAALPFAQALAEQLASLAEIEYPPVTSVALGFQRDHVAHPLDGFGVLVPACENLKILGTLFNSSLFPGRAPNGCVLLTTFVGGTRQPELAALPSAELRRLVLDDLRKLLGVSSEPLCTHVTAWPRAIPQYNLGYARFHTAMDIAEKSFPGLLIGGHARDGVSVGDCIRAGWQLAQRTDGAATRSIVN
jgi:protoporphyrinogen/coproporphyrinogen III oxidase